MQIRRRGERGANPIVGSPLLMYSLHLVHVGGRASVDNTPSVTHAALSLHMAGGSCAQDLGQCIARI